MKTVKQTNPGFAAETKEESKPGEFFNARSGRRAPSSSIMANVNSMFRSFAEKAKGYFAVDGNSWLSSIRFHPVIIGEQVPGMRPNLEFMVVTYKEYSYIIINGSKITNPGISKETIGGVEYIHENQPADVYNESFRRWMHANYPNSPLHAGVYVLPNGVDLNNNPDDIAALSGHIIDVMAAVSGNESTIHIEDYAGHRITADFVVAPGSGYVDSDNQPVASDLTVVMTATESRQKNNGDVAPINLCWASAILESEFHPSMDNLRSLQYGIKPTQHEPAYLPSVIMTGFGSSAPGDHGMDDLSVLLTSIIAMAKATEANGWISVFNNSSVKNIATLGREWDATRFSNPTPAPILETRKVVPGVATDDESLSVHEFTNAFFYQDVIRFYIDVTKGSSKSWIAEAFVNLARYKNKTTDRNYIEAVTSIVAAADALTGNRFSEKLVAMGLKKDQTLSIPSDFFVENAIAIEAAVFAGPNDEPTDVRSMDTFYLLEQVSADTMRHYRAGMQPESHNFQTQVIRENELRKNLPRYNPTGTIMRLNIGNAFITALSRAFTEATGEDMVITGLPTHGVTTERYKAFSTMSGFSTKNDSGYYGNGFYGNF